MIQQLRKVRLLVLIFFLIYECIVIGLGDPDLYKLNVVMFLFLNIFGFVAFRYGKSSFTNIYFIVLLTIPFYILFDVLIYGEIIDIDRVMTSPLLADVDILFLLSYWILLGLTGFLFGIILGENVKLTHRPGKQTKPKGTLPVPAFLIITVLLVVIYYIISPKGSILSGYYSDIRDSKNDGGFSGVDYFLQAVVLILFLDFKRSIKGVGKKRKAYIWFTAFVYIVIFLHILKGERAIAGTCYAVFLVHMLYDRFSGGKVVAAVTPLKTTVVKGKKKNYRLFLLLPLFIGTFYFLGFVRNESSSNVNADNVLAIFTNSYKMGTWKGGFYAAIGMADEYNTQRIEYYGGQTYIDYLLSLPPSFIASALNYERPISSTSGPGYWYMGYTSGGISPLIVPFKNFGFMGIFIMMVLWGAGIVLIERKLLDGWVTPFKLYLYSTFIMVTPHLFWYGEMYVVRGLMAALVVYYLYNKLVK